jgi:hypothetical protein
MQPVRGGVLDGGCVRPAPNVDHRRRGAMLGAVVDWIGVAPCRLETQKAAGSGSGGLGTARRPGRDRDVPRTEGGDVTNARVVAEYLPDTVLHHLNGEFVVALTVAKGFAYLLPDEADALADSLKDAATIARQYRESDDDDE